MSERKCTRHWHDSFGENYDDCNQCWIRDNGPHDENPWLMTPEQLKKWFEKNKPPAGGDE